MNWTLRLARTDDILALEELIPLSVRSLQAAYYTPAQMEAAIGPVFGVDLQLIADGTYFVAIAAGQIIGCGGWSRGRSLCGSGAAGNSFESQLDPAKDTARIRAFFVHPGWARRGVGRSLLAACERAILDGGFQRVELLATLAGEPLYAAGSYRVLERYELDMPGGLRLPVVRMAKELRQ